MIATRAVADRTAAEDLLRRQLASRRGPRPRSARGGAARLPLPRRQPEVARQHPPPRLQGRARVDDDRRLHLRLRRDGARRAGFGVRGAGRRIRAVAGDAAVSWSSRTRGRCTRSPIGCSKPPTAGCGNSRPARRSRRCARCRLKAEAFVEARGRSASRATPMRPTRVSVSPRWSGSTTLQDWRCSSPRSIAGLSVLIRGDKGAGKSTAARGLVDLLEHGAPFINLPIGATEDRLLGGLDLEKALERRAGAEARAAGGGPRRRALRRRGQPAARSSGRRAARRGRQRRPHGRARGFSAEQEAAFVMIGWMNPEEGALRPQLLDRFALAVDVSAPADMAIRRMAVERRLAFDAHPEGFTRDWQDEQMALVKTLTEARARASCGDLPVRAARSRERTGLRARCAFAPRRSRHGSGRPRDRGARRCVDSDPRTCRRRAAVGACVTASRTGHACRKRRRLPPPTPAAMTPALRLDDPSRRAEDASEAGDTGQAPHPALAPRRGAGRCRGNASSRRFRSPCRAWSRQAVTRCARSPRPRVQRDGRRGRHGRARSGHRRASGGRAARAGRASHNRASDQ